ncbi:MAG: S-layer protein, partial [Candidatus Micrarchaeota archaeon]|nr:S-layer protein [Candidatus Micrarchaeota archaeon]
MNRLNAKRIGVLAASLLFGLAVAGPVSFSNIPIINSAGQPVVQIVVGGTAQPSDGVVAANIAAVIGNLAFTSTPVTATVGGQSNLSCVVTTATCSVSGQQVWLGEAGVAASAGSFTFTTLIGSILNRGITLGSLAATKLTTPSSQYG